MSRNKQKKLNISSNEESSNEESSNEKSSNEETSISSINDDNLREISEQPEIEEHENNLEKEFSRFDCNNDNNIFSNKCNKFLLKKEIMEREYLSSNEKQFDYLYPNLNDKDFNIKIANKKEFNDTTYDGTIYENIKKQADILANIPYELQPHQTFVKNFMSFQTPYSSLLLFHGLGSGKTCSAIGVCEEMRDYMKQIGATKRIIIVASENVQNNFKTQLFDERNLKQINGVWNIKGCVGNKLLKEINPMNLPMTKEKVIYQIKNVINNYYIFLGYIQFANYIIKTIHREEEPKKQKNKEITLNDKIIRRLQNEFNNRLIVIDEVHNIRKTDDNDNKKVAINLELLVKASLNIRFLFLSATPMYNSYKEIIWLLNIMNMNDKRAKIETKDIFNKDGNFKKKGDKNIGEELLIRKATGYVSFVRGENPYTFPYRIYPNLFDKDHTFLSFSYPSYQMNLKKIRHEDKKRILGLYLTQIGSCNNCGNCQYCCYKYIIYNLRNKNFSVVTKEGVTRQMPSFENMETFGYTMLQTPIESLIISYPSQKLKSVLDELKEKPLSKEFSPSFSELSEQMDEINDTSEDIPEYVEEEQYKRIVKTNMSVRKDSSDDVYDSGDSIISKDMDDQKVGDDNDDETVKKQLAIDPHILTGKIGLERMMNFIDSRSPPLKGEFEYKPNTLKTYGNIYSYSEIGKYSSKIKSILQQIYVPETKRVSDGIILIYSQYIDSGLIPMALALEEMGFTRYGQTGIKPLFKKRPTEVVDVRTMEPPKDKTDFKPARYSLITGDTRISPNNDFEVKGLTDKENVDGNKVKIILISRAGSEGIDFKYIRQVHILDPWYNMNRIEQIIGRAVRNFSHKDLPFEKRNVEIYMYATILDENIEEAADLYVYRVAEHKALQIGKVTRLLKETAVDCIIHQEQQNFTQEIMASNLNEKITQITSTGKTLDNFIIGDVPFSPNCDYMATCNYNCRPNQKIDDSNLNEDTYNENYIVINSEKIIQRIRMLFKESFFYKKDTLLRMVRTPKEYPYVQIYSALTQIIEDDNEFIVDKYGRNGKLINIGEYYLFQPVELTDKSISIYERSVPLDYKHSMVQFELKKEIAKKDSKKEKETQVISNNVKGEKTFKELKEQYQICIDYLKERSVPRGDDNWYKHCGIAIQKMNTEFPDSKQYLLSFLVAHMIELLLFGEKIELMNYIYSFDNIPNASLERFIKNYFENNTIVANKKHVFIGYNLNKREILILNKNNVWERATPMDEEDIAKSPVTKNFLKFSIEDYNNIVGFVGYDKNNKDLVFKTKNMLSSRDTGARCDQATKRNNINKINSILGEEKYTIENTKIIKDKNGNIIHEAISNIELCILEEFILRYFNVIEKDNKKYFVTPELAIWYKLYKIFT
jgi:hypothetical protein